MKSNEDVRNQEAKDKTERAQGLYNQSIKLITTAY